MQKFRKYAGVMCVLFIVAFAVPCNVFGEAEGAGAGAEAAGTAAGTTAAGGITVGTVAVAVAVAAVAGVIIAEIISDDDVTTTHHDVTPAQP